MTSTVIIVTLNRPDCVERCLSCLFKQEPLPRQIIVVDASPDRRTQEVVAAYPGVEYLRNDNGFGRMTASRNIGLKVATGDVIAFVDDDAFAHEGWLKQLMSAYEGRPDVGAVGGRALNNQPGEEREGVDRVGRLTGNGLLEGWFAADTKQVIEVDHIIGCNMSFRREVLAELGGFREDYPGVSGVREDSDMCLRVRAAGYKLLFTPYAVVTHIGAPQVKGRRFDTRYTFYAARNHAALLVRNCGLLSGVVGRYLMWATRTTLGECIRRIVGALLRLVVVIVGTLLGLISGITKLITLGREPRRTDADGETIREALRRRHDVPVSVVCEVSKGESLQRLEQ